MHPWWNYNSEFERRLTFRLQLGTTAGTKVAIAIWNNDEQVAEGFICDLALGGMGVCITEQLADSLRECRAHFTLPVQGTKYPFDLRCEIVHQTVVDQRIICGLEFLDILETHCSEEYNALLDYLTLQMAKAKVSVPCLIRPWPETT